jgi:hypothetical protein
VGVPTAGLSQYGVSPTALAREALARYETDMAGVLDARTRARGAR